MESATSELSRVFGALLQRGDVELPPMPGTAAQVMDLAQQESTDARKLSDVIHSDQAIASNVMRVANSAAYSGEVPIASLQQAVSRLGLQLITEISMAVSLRGRLFRNKTCAELLAIQWRHSVLVGFYTKEIARLRRRNVEIAFLCGLLHDVGKAVLLNNVDRVLQDQDVALPVADLCEAVHVQHTEAGKLLSSRWKLPEQIADAIVCHHAPSESESFADMAMMVSLADTLSHHLLPDPHSETVEEEQIRGLEEVVALNLYSDQVDALLAMKDKAFEVMEGMQ